MLDLIVAQCDDCHMSRLADLLEYFELPTLRLGVPSDWQKTLSMQYYIEGLGKVRDYLEELTGVPITNQRLEASVGSLNKVRSRLRAI